MSIRSFFASLFGHTPLHPVDPDFPHPGESGQSAWPYYGGPDSLEEISDDLVEIVWRLKDLRDDTAKTLAETRAKCDALVAEHNHLVAEVNQTEQLRLSVESITGPRPPVGPQPANDDEPTAAAPVQTLAVETGDATSPA